MLQVWVGCSGVYVGFLSHLGVIVVAEAMKNKKGGLEDYFLLRNSFVPSMSVMYWNPCSIRSVASLMLVAVLQVYSSESSGNIAFSRFMYIMVLSIFLCPKTVFTWMMSLVLWYSIVPL